VHSADAHFNLLLSLLNILGIGIPRQILVRPVWVPTVMPAATTSRVNSGCQVACSPISKNVALMQLAFSAFNTIGVFSGHGPSSKVSTTSLSRRKSYCLKCSVPNAGPPVVSISTTRDRPIASGLLQAGMALAADGVDAAGATSAEGADADDGEALRAKGDGAGALAAGVAVDCAT